MIKKELTKTAFQTLHITSEEIRPFNMLNLEWLEFSNVRELITLGNTPAIDSLNDLFYPHQQGGGKLFLINNLINKTIKFEAPIDHKWIVCLIGEESDHEQNIRLNGAKLEPLREFYLESGSLEIELLHEQAQVSKLYIFTNWTRLNTKNTL